MKTLIKDSYWKILELFYCNKNTPLHLRRIARKIGLSQGSLVRHLNSLLKDKILTFSKEGNLKRFWVIEHRIPGIFPIFDFERYENLPFIRKNAIMFFLSYLERKPVFVILFGSTAQGTQKKDSDIDLILVFNKETKTEAAKKHAEAQTGIIINDFKLTYNKFIEEIKMKSDPVVQAGLETGFPIYNHYYFYKVMNDE
jgi:predicted nucleotidyltransferase